MAPAANLKDRCLWPLSLLSLALALVALAADFCRTRVVPRCPWLCPCCPWPWLWSCSGPISCAPSCPDSGRVCLCPLFCKCDLSEDLHAALEWEVPFKCIKYKKYVTDSVNNQNKIETITRMGYTPQPKHYPKTLCYSCSFLLK